MPPPELAQAVPVRNDAHRRRRRRLRHRHRHGRASPASSPPRRISDNLGQPRTTSGDLGQSRQASSLSSSACRAAASARAVLCSTTRRPAARSSSWATRWSEIAQDRPRSRSPEIEMTRECSCLLAPRPPPLLSAFGEPGPPAHTHTYTSPARAGPCSSDAARPTPPGSCLWTRRPCVCGGVDLTLPCLTRTARTWPASASPPTAASPSGPSRSSTAFALTCSPRRLKSAQRGRALVLRTQRRDR